MTTLIFLKILSRYDEPFMWHWPMVLLPSVFTQTFTREFRTWNTVSGQPKLWPLHGFSISIDVDFEDVRLLLVSPLAAGDLSKMSRDNLSNKDQIVTFVSAFTLRHIHCPSNSIVSGPGHRPWPEEFAWFRHNPWRYSCSRSLVIIDPSYSFYFRVTSWYAPKGIVTWPTSALQRCLGCPHLVPSQKWCTVVGRHQNWMSSREVSRVIYSRLHAQFTRFLFISLIYRRYSRICAL